jgi:hypothetical protein
MVWWQMIHWLLEYRVAGFWEDVGCIKPLTLCGTEDGYAPAQSREAAFKGKGSFLHVDRASLDMMHVYLVAANFVQAHASRQPERGIHHLNYIIMGV